MLKQTSILLATLFSAASLTACIDSSKNDPTIADENNTDKKDSHLMKATKAAIIIESYDPGANQSSSANQGDSNSSNNDYKPGDSSN